MKRSASSTQGQYKPTPPILPSLVQNPTIEPPTLPFDPTKGITQPQKTSLVTPELAVKIALQLQPSLKIAQAQAISARGLLIQARSGLYPTETLSTGYSYQTRLGQLGLSGSSSSFSSTGTLSGFSTQLQLKQLVFDFGRTVSQVNQAKYTANAAKFLSTKAAEDLAFAVLQQYYTTQQAFQQINVDQSDVQSQQQSLNLATGLLKHGQGAPSDVVTAESNLNNSTLALSQAQATAFSDRVALAALIGVDPRTPLLLSDSIPNSLTLPSLELAVNQALTSRPEVQAARETVSAANAGIRAVKLGLAPSLSLSLSLGSRGSTDPFGTDTTTAAATVSVPFGDGGLTQGKVEQANAVLSEALASLKQAQLQAVQDVSQAYVAMNAAIQKQKVAVAEVANAQEAVKLAQGRYRAGIALFLEVTNAQALFVTAQTNLLAAQAQLAIAQAQFKHATGVMN